MGCRRRVCPFEADVPFRAGSHDAIGLIRRLRGRFDEFRDELAFGRHGYGVTRPLPLKDE